MTSIQVKGPLNNGTSAVKNQSDLTRSRVQLNYLVTEADPATAALSIDGAISAALGSALLDTTIPKYGGIVRQNASARRVGPKKVEVTITLARSPSPPTPSGEIISLNTKMATVPVYRLPAIVTQTGANLPGGSTPCANGPCTTPSISATSGLPSGDWADTASLAGQTGPVAEANPRTYPWPIPEVDVQIPGKLTQAEFNGIHEAGGAMLFVGYWNSVAFEWGDIEFDAETLLFNGCNAQWVQENGVFVYYVRYSFTWRPTGWYSQIAPKDNSTGLLTTQDVKVVGQVTSFLNLFPV
jgi:hypothetical protein